MLNFLRILILALLVPAINKVYGIDQPKKVYKYERAELEGYPNEAFVLPRGQPDFISVAYITKDNEIELRNRGEPIIKGIYKYCYLKLNDQDPRNRGKPKKDTS